MRWRSETAHWTFLEDIRRDRESVAGRRVLYFSFFNSCRYLSKTVPTSHGVVFILTGVLRVLFGRKMLEVPGKDKEKTSVRGHGVRTKTRPLHLYFGDLLWTDKALFPSVGSRQYFMTSDGVFMVAACGKRPPGVLLLQDIPVQLVPFLRIWAAYRKPASFLTFGCWSEGEVAD